MTQRRGGRNETLLRQRGVSPNTDVTLLDLLDRILDKGVVVSGDITLAVADVDLVYVGLRALLTSVETAQSLSRGEARGGAK